MASKTICAWEDNARLQNQLTVLWVKADFKKRDNANWKAASSA
jgi:hypothetical protein